MKLSTRRSPTLRLTLRRLIGRQAAAEPPVPTDYHDIIAKTIATLDNSTVGTRHAVYGCCTAGRLSEARPQPSRAVARRVRSGAAITRSRHRENRGVRCARCAARSCAGKSCDRDGNAAAARDRACYYNDASPRLPQACYFRGGIMRLFGMTAFSLRAEILFGYCAGSGSRQIPVRRQRASRGTQRGKRKKRRCPTRTTRNSSRRRPPATNFRRC